MYIFKHPLFLLIFSSFLLLFSCDDDNSSKNSNNNNINNDAGTDGDVDDADITDDIIETECIEAEGTLNQSSDTWVDNDNTATISASGNICSRTFSHQSTQGLRDNNPSNPRTYSELSGWPSVSTNNLMFDALYALSLEETRLCSVNAIEDYAYNNGQPIECPPGGCFETGRLWKFVWTRDTAYAVDLGLAALNPARSRNSLEFKVSNLRSGGNPQIIQDTGSGGSYPVSTDRAVWAIGAQQLINYLHGDELVDFINLAWEATKNTIEQDRETVFISENGLYLGEQSFLDWREQSYPFWTATDTVQIHMSQALSTNVGHLRLLDLGAWLAKQVGETELGNTYEAWAEQLRTNIDEVFYQSDFGLWGTFTTGVLDRISVRHFDLLGSSLAILSDIGNEIRQDEAVSKYPHLEKGPAVIWPQQKDIPIYHNRGIWPFVTAYWLKAAKKVKNDKAVNLNVHSLIRGAAMNISNMENFEVVTGMPWLDDGDYSGPVVNSQRQLWSVAAYVSMVHDVFFGLEANPDGIRFLPFITKALRNNMFAQSHSLVLNNFKYKGKVITVVVNLPDVDDVDEGAYEVGAIKLNETDITHDFISYEQLDEKNVIDIQLSDSAIPGKSITLETDTSEYRKLFSPLTPVITNVRVENGNLEVLFNANGETTDDITFNIYRDKELVASNLPGNTTSWIDTEVSWEDISPCYTVEAEFVVTGVSGNPNVSQHAKPRCYWGEGYERISSVYAVDFISNGGNFVDNHGRQHYENWGEEEHTITVEDFTASFTGEHLLQVEYGNGAGNFSTGITCVTKKVDIYEGETLVGTGYFVMPHLASWDNWGNSNFVKVDLESGKTYRFVIYHSENTINMSDFEHNALYSGTGGSSGSHHYVNISELKILSLSGIN
ncbi:MAG: amylo-alpha-1,6-glucosidase [Myxococcota bacterium]